MALAVTAARVVLLAVIAFGLVATGVAVLVGPVFIPFFLVPQLDWLFWGWLKSLLQYAFYQVIAQAFVFVFGTLPHRTFSTRFRRPTPWTALLVGGFHLIFLLIAFTYGLLKVPSLTTHCFPAGPASPPCRVSWGSDHDHHRSRAPAVGYEYGEARRRYVEQYGSTLVMNTYLKLALLCLSVVAVGLIGAHPPDPARRAARQAAGHPDR